MKHLIIYTALIFFTAINGYSQSKIKKAENSLNKDEEKTTTSNRNEHKNRNDNDAGGDNFFADAIAELLLKSVLYASYYTLVESPPERDYNASQAFITKYPYYNSKKGNYSYDWGENTDVFRTLLSGRYVSENSRIKGAHLNLDMRFLKRIGFEADYLQLWENSPNFGSDNLAIYTALAKYHRVRTEKFDAWWGLGGSFVDGQVDRFGFSYGLGAELFFAKPISLESNFNQTFINTETVNKLNILINYHTKRYLFTGGYEHLKIGNQKFATITIGTGVFF